MLNSIEYASINELLPESAANKLYIDHKIDDYCFDSDGREGESLCKDCDSNIALTINDSVTEVEVSLLINESHGETYETAKEQEGKMNEEKLEQMDIDIIGDSLKNIMNISFLSDDSTEGTNRKEGKEDGGTKNIQREAQLIDGSSHEVELSLLINELQEEMDNAIKYAGEVVPDRDEYHLDKKQASMIDLISIDGEELVTTSSESDHKDNDTDDTSNRSRDNEVDFNLIFIGESESEEEVVASVMEEERNKERDCKTKAEGKISKPVLLGTFLLLIAYSCQYE